jgi:hypothetical protein
MGMIKIYINIKSCFLFFFRRVYLAKKKNDENKIKYAIKVINKQDIRKKNLMDQSNKIISKQNFYLKKFFFL